LLSLGDRKVPVRFRTNSDASNQREASQILARATYGDFMRVGAEIYEKQGNTQGVRPGLLHSKVVRSDDDVTVVQSSNWNKRSTLHDGEIAAVIEDGRLAKQVDDRFELSIARSHKVAPDE